MPYFATSHEWLNQSCLLLQAHPRTTHITTKYSASIPPNSRRGKKRSKRFAQQNPSRPGISPENPPNAPEASTANPTGSLSLKTYDPESGVCLQYRTKKAAEVGRLISGLGRLGKGMSGRTVEDIVPPLPAESEMMEDTAVAAANTEEAKKSQQVGKGTPGNAGGGGGGGAGKKKKKKGKK